MSLDARDDSGAATRTTADARAAAVHALRAVEEGERDSLDALRTALCGYLTALRAEGVQKPDALERVRAVISEPATDDPGWLLPAAREALMDLAMYWCTEQYSD